MHRGFHPLVTSAGALSLLLCGGCAQMTRHSNLLVFGTNTVFGVRVGTAATQVPSIDVGYSRQEAVLMPLVANTSASQSDPKTLVPCDVSKDVKVVTGDADASGTKLADFAVHPCLLVATDGKQAKDSYSVPASFGANFGASAKPTETTAQGGLAQYLATGMAAQLLALNGGAAVVATGRRRKQRPTIRRRR
jgi:hypothetical protein